MDDITMKKSRHLLPCKRRERISKQLRNHLQKDSIPANILEKYMAFCSVLPMILPRIS